MTPLVLIVGFLGSGKTTFLKSLLPALNAAGVEPHVIINDYQNAKVDAEQLGALTNEVKAISGDCVCCGSRDELLGVLENFEHSPGRAVVVETNGTTDSEQLVEMLSLEPGLRKFSLPVQMTIVDAKRWQKRFWHNSLERDQARTATHLFLSRSDVVEPRRLADVEKSLADLGLGGRRVDANSLAVEIRALCDDLAARPERSLGCGEGCSHDHHHEHGEHEHHEHSHQDHHFASVELALPDAVSRQRFGEFLKTLPDEVIRAKGIVRFTDAPDELFVFQKVDRFDEPQFFPVGKSPRVSTPLALFIGPHLPESLLRDALKTLV
ncbi:MAG: CobW family GTP-binding protein [Terrimicrobiaceae bacterium]